MSKSSSEINTVTYIKDVDGCVSYLATSLHMFAQDCVSFINTVYALAKTFFYGKSIRVCARSNKHR